MTIGFDSSGNVWGHSSTGSPYNKRSVASGTGSVAPESFPESQRVSNVTQREGSRAASEAQDYGETSRKESRRREGAFA